MANANDRQVGGGHYMGSIQHWDLAAQRNYDYFQGQITKYVDRWKNKNGLQDLKKAQHFLEKYIELVEAGVFSGGKESQPPTPDLGVLKNFIAPAFYEVRELFETEGFTADGDFWRCKKCRARIQVFVGANPVGFHDCPPPGEPTAGYVDQD